MSAFGASKLSEVLRFLSEQSDVKTDENGYENVTAHSKNDQNKQVFTDAVSYCVELLRSTGRINDQRSEIISDESTLMGHEMFERIINVGVQMDIEVKDEFFSNHLGKNIKLEPENYLEGIVIDSYSSIKEMEETSSVTSPSKSSASEEATKNDEKNFVAFRTRRRSSVLPDETPNTEHMSLRKRSGNFDYKELPPSPVSLVGSDDNEDLPTRQHFIPLEIKMKVVKLARTHPTWSLATLQKNGSVLLRNMEQLKKWKMQVDNGGTFRDKYKRINDKTYERFVQARAAGQRVSTLMLRQWAVKIARGLYKTSIKFDASKNWATNFKKMYRLEQSVAKSTIEELQLIGKEGERNRKTGR